MLDQLSSANFSPHLNQIFQLDLASDQALNAELIQITDLNTDAQAAQRQPFSLIFRCELNIRLPQQIYRLTHQELDTLEIFLVPIGPDQIGLCYEAVFN